MYQLTDEQEAFILADGKKILCACPGSGKTYIVARKVLNYLDKWTLNHQGMAVLSFTNVASQEIMNQLESINENYRNVGYPHFVGTVDSFINTFIVLQYGYLYNESRTRPQIALSDVWNYPFGYWRTECHQSVVTPLKIFIMVLMANYTKITPKSFVLRIKGEKCHPVLSISRFMRRKESYFKVRFLHLHFVC